MILPVIAGVLLIASVLWEAFETVVLPRRATRRFRLTRLFYRSTWLPWRSIARQIRRPKTRETFLSYYGPLSLLFLFVAWAIALIFAFGFLYFAASRHEPVAPTLATCVYLSGTSLFTLGLGDVTPHTWTERWLIVCESGLGFGFLALVFSYLPVIYQAFSRREVSIVLLDARAGSPPTAVELLRRHTGAEGMDALEILLRDWERVSAETLESHVSYPVVSYFRSQHNNESWIAALAAILDTAALLLSTVESDCIRQARLTFAMCRHTVVDLAQLFSAAPQAPSRDRLPPDELHRLRASLEQAGFRLRDTDASREKFAKLREMYEPYIESLGRFLLMEIPPWILAKEITDNWKTSAWGRISGFATPTREEITVDDHD
ncbi:MAG TPA: potassium channel family protein [Candidatus Limnocylindrales bacterium]|nr:potassium channel family protein [Candidatus Limnocylindrales bacterium]